jgi:preprotein translocase subunit SecE
MARNRQRAKERQAERRAARQAARDDTGAVPDAQQRVEAPPQELGQSGYTLEHTSEAEEFIGDLEIGERWEDGDSADGTESGATETEDTAKGPRGVRGGREREEEHHREHSRVVSFLIAVWAELNRVQWPNRQQLTSLTGITLLFVLLVGGYLGLLDAVFSKLVSAIL